jgi:hypothetical protein
MNNYFGYPARHLSTRFFEMDVLETAGPRIVSLSYQGSPNLFAELPELSNSTPYGVFHFMGGHRLWHSPEAMPRSYIPDNDGLTFTDLPDGFVLDGKTEPGTGMHKRIEVHFHPDQAVLHLTHTLVNEGLWDVELAPWALSMFRLGGTVILPTQNLEGCTDGLLPNRNLVLWPYTRLQDPRLRIEDDFILLKARPDFPKIKLGAFIPRGWIAYYIDGVLFRKTFDALTDKLYPDYNCNTETYTDSRFVELESLGPLTRLAPGQAVHHTETWELFDSLEQGFMPAKAVELLK